MPEELKEGEDFYYDPGGYVVLTAAYHLKKGSCCGNGCRHCPYDYINVAEPQRTQLLKQRQDEKSKTSN